MSSTESIVRQIIYAVLDLLQELCHNGAVTATVKSRHVRARVGNGGPVVNELLKAIMESLGSEKLVRIYRRSCGYIYVVKCSDLPRVREKLLQLATH